MDKKRRIIVWITVCSIWNLAVIIPHIIMRSHLKFPTLNFEFYGWLIPVFMTVPFHCLFFGIVSVYRKKIMKAFAVCYTVVGIFCYITFLTFTTMCFTEWEPGLYPLVSETDNVADYLVTDNEMEYDKIYKIFPEKIPERVEGVEYKYRYEPLELDYNVDAKWSLPQADYDTEKARVRQNAEECREEDGKTICKLWWRSDEVATPGIYYNIDVEFEDKTQAVRYHLLKNTITS